MKRMERCDMKKETAKRVLAIAVAASLIFLFGCMKSTDGQVETPVSEEMGPTVIDTVSDEGSDSAEHSGIYYVDATTDESDSGSYASTTSDENVVLVENAGVLSMTSADINKLGDATGSFSSGQNAAFAVTTQSSCALSGSNITTNAFGAYGLYVSGAGSLIAAADNYIVTAGSSSPALVAADGGSMTVSGGTASTEGSDSPAVVLSGDAVLSLSGVSLSAKSSDLISVLSGDCTLNADAQALSGTVTILDDATLTLNLENGSSFTGAFGDTFPANASVSLDASSIWSLTADTNVTVFVNEDATHQNIESNGFSIYYDSNAPENESLNGQSFALPGGGFLVPII